MGMLRSLMLALAGLMALSVTSAGVTDVARAQGITRGGAEVAASGATRFAAIWTKGSAWQARHDLTSSQYQSTFDSLVGQGYTLVDVDGYTGGGDARFAAIWTKGGSWQARHDLTSSQYQSTFDSLVGQGYTLSHVSGY